MIYLKWLALALLDWAMHLTLLVAPPIIAAFTREMPYGLRPYTWGSLWGTWDNPPQGDQGFVSKHAIYAGVTTGWRGYINRVQWMWRNKLYGLAKLMAVPYSPDFQLSYVGDATISDKHKRPGYYFARLHDGKRLAAFELYCVLPWSETRNLRMRLGWKMMTDKFQRYGFAQLVNTFNPFDGYGDKEKPLI